MNQSDGKRNAKKNEKRKNNIGRDMPELSFGIPAKLIQYLMLILLLVLVFLVSAYAGLARRERNDGGMSTAEYADTEEKGFTDGSTGADAGEDGRVNGSTGADAGEDGCANGSTGTDAGENRRAGGTSDMDGGRDERANGTGGAEEEGGGSGKTDRASKGTIVLDAGHGGFDPGVMGSSGVAERELNLIFAKKLETLLVEEGYQVVQTRPTEAGLYDENQAHKKAQDMQRRCAVIEAAQPLATVSIHQNSYPDSSVFGPQVFYYAQSKEGERLATCIQNCMNEQLEVERPKLQKGNESYYILKRSAGTAVIVECGFLTNPEEEEKLQDETYQDRAVRAICDGILQYLETKEEN